MENPMPRKPFAEQASWQISAHGRNFSLTYHRRMIRFMLTGLPNRYRSWRLGVTRNRDMKPLIRNGKKPR